MEVQHLRYFYEVARRGSFTEAARSLRISQPSLSKQVKLLETLEGLTFLDRRKSGVRLTPMGEILYRHCQVIFDEVASIQRSISNRKEECEGELSIGASDNLCNHLLPEVLGRYCALYPRIQVSLYCGVSSEIAERVQDFRIELGLFYTFFKNPLLTFEKIKDVEFCVLVSKDSPFRKVKRIAELREASYIGSRTADYRSPYPTLKMLRGAGLNPQNIIQTNSQETQKKLCLAGVGYTVNPIHTVRHELKSGELVQVPTSTPFMSPLYLVRRKHRFPSKAAELWLTLFRATLKTPVVVT